MNITNVESSPGLGAERTVSSAPAPVATSAAVGKESTKPIEGSGVEAAATHQALSREQIGEVAQQLEEAINQAYGTKVRFNVSPKEKDHTFSFQIVDSKTGEVLREFPEDALLELAKSGKIIDGHGLFIDSPA